MENKWSVPCQVCTVTSTKGEIMPLWCRYQEETGEIITIKIDEAKKMGPPSMTSNMIFDCLSCEAEREVGFRLQMDCRTFQWRLIFNSCV